MFSLIMVNKTSSGFIQHHFLQMQEYTEAMCSASQQQRIAAKSAAHHKCAHSQW